MSNSSWFHTSEGALIWCRSQEPFCQPLTRMPSCRPGLTLALLRDAARQTITTSLLGAASAQPKDTTKSRPAYVTAWAPAGSSRDQPPALSGSSTRFFPSHTYQHSARPGVSRPSPFATQQAARTGFVPVVRKHNMLNLCCLVPGSTSKHPQPPCRQTPPDGPLGICLPQTAAVPAWVQPHGPTAPARPPDQSSSSSDSSSTRFLPPALAGMGDSNGGATTPTRNPALVVFAAALGGEVTVRVCRTKANA